MMLHNSWIVLWKRASPTRRVVCSLSSQVIPKTAPSSGPRSSMVGHAYRLLCYRAQRALSALVKTGGSAGGEQIPESSKLGRSATAKSNSKTRTRGVDGFSASKFSIAGVFAPMVGTCSRQCNHPVVRVSLRCVRALSVYSYSSSTLKVGEA